MKGPSKKILLILSIFLIFLVMGAASAAENDDSINETDDVLTVDESAVSEDIVSADTSSENTEVLSDEGNSEPGSFAELETYINDNKGYEKTIYLNKDYEFNNESDIDYNVTGIYLGSYISIDGQGHTIDAKNTSYIFNILGKNVNLKNIRFINTTNSAVKVFGTDVSISDCNFDYTGRGVSIQTDGKRCIVDHCTFTHGRGIYCVGAGSLIKDSLFENNNVSSGSGVYVSNCLGVVIDNCEFKNNNATNGIIYFNYDPTYGLLTIQNCKFYNNSAMNGGAIYSGNAVVWDNKWVSKYNTVKIISCSFKDNIAVQYPNFGGPRLHGDYPGYNIDQSTTFDEGKYYDPIDKVFDDVVGGTVNLNDDYILTKGPITLDLESDLTINGNNHIVNANGNKFLDIKAKTGSAIKIIINNLTVINGFSNTQLDSGAIGLEGVFNAEFNYCKFINNTAWRYGGAIYAAHVGESCTVLINNSAFYNNTVLNDDGQGGALRFSGSTVPIIWYSDFKYNYAPTGGVFYRNGGSMTLRYSNFTNNSATNCGVFYKNGRDNAANWATGCYFINNSAYSNPVHNRGVDFNGATYENNFLIVDPFANYFNNQSIGCTINIPKSDYYFNSTVTLSYKNMIINGNGSTIYGNNNSVFAFKNAENSIITNFTFVNCTFRSFTGSINCTFSNLVFINCSEVGVVASVLDNVTFINVTSPYINPLVGRQNYIKNINIDGVRYTDNLVTLFSDLKENSTLVLPKGEYELIVPIIIESTNNVVIDGNGSTIKSLVNKGLFEVYSNNVTFKNFKLENASTAIYFDGNPYYYDTSIYDYTKVYCTIENMEFKDCNGLNSKGAGTVKDCKFIITDPNKANVVMLNYQAIQTSDPQQIVSPINVTNCEFISNSNIVINKAINVYNSINVYDSKFENIKVSGSGGAIYTETSGNITNCNFTNCVSLTGKGGAVFTNFGGSVVDCNFVNCSAVSGGAIYEKSKNTHLTVRGSTFDGGNAFSAGGAINCMGNLIIDDCEFTNNTADNCAGFISATGLTLTNSNFTNNDATLGGAGSVDGDNTLIENCKFDDNNAMVGGGLNVQGNNGTVKNCNFTNNTATAVSSALDISGNQTKLVGCTIEGSSAPDGAAIKITGNQVNITDCTFKDNTAEDVNGSMLTVDGDGTNLEKVNVTGNNGHGIELNGNNATLKDNIVANNNGTAITVNGNGAKVEGTNINNNNGDAVVINGNKTTFADNTVAGNNGTAVTVNGNDAVIEKSNITSNDGEGVVINGNGTKATENTVSGNNGTAVTVNGNNATIEKTNVTENNGEGVVINGNGTKATENTVSGNNGTAMTVNGNDAVIEKTNVTDNKGDGLVINGNGTRASENTVSGNNGTAMTVNGNDAVIEKTNVTENNGDGLVINGNGTRASENTVSGNNGTAMTVNGNDAEIEKTNITGNDGAGMVVNGDNTKINDNTISNNTEAGVVINGDDVNITNNNISNSESGEDIVIGENSNMNTPEKMEEISKENNGAEVLKDNGLYIIILPDVAHVDENITLIVNIASGAGTARIIVNGKEYNLTESTVIELGLLPVGDYDIFVEFSNNPGFTPFNDTVVSFHVQNWNFTELQQLIDNATANNETIVELTHDYVCEAGENPITINDTIQIKGNDHTIDANDNKGAFNITADGVELADMTITNVKDGVAISAVGNDTKLSDIELTNNTGSGIIVEGNNATIDDITGNNHNGALIAVIGDDNNITNTTVNDGNGTGIYVIGDNNKVEDTTGKDHEGTLVYVDGNDNNIDNTTVRGGNGTIVDIADGSDNVIDCINRSDYGGDSIVDNGDNTVVENNGTDVPDTSLARLQELINKAAAEGKTTFDLDRDYAYTEGDKAIDVPAGMTINGNGHTINATGHNGVFDITNDNVTLKDLNIENVNGTAINAVADNFKADGINLTNNTGKGINIVGNGSDIENVVGNNHTGDLITIEGDNAAVKGTIVNGGNGTGIQVKGDNNTVENTVGNDHDGTLVSVDGNDNAVNNSTANGGNGTVVNVVNGTNNTVDGVNSTNHTGDELVDNGNNTKKSGIKPASEDTAFDLSKANADPAVFTINLPKDATGNFTVSVGGKDYTAAVVNGTATVSVPGLASGSQAVVVSYSGDKQYSPLFKTATVNIPTPTPAPTPTPTGPQPIVIDAKKKVTFKKSKRSKTKSFKFTLKSNGVKVSGKKVFFKLDKKALKTLKAKNKKGKKLLKQLKKGKYSVATKGGVATLKLLKSMFKFKKGKGKITATFKGDAGYTASKKVMNIVLK